MHRVASSYLKQTITINLQLKLQALRHENVWRVEVNGQFHALAALPLGKTSTLIS
jgi:hypothetical protein